MGISVLDFVRFALAFIRLGTFFAIVPLFNMKNVPILAKLGFAALCSLIIMPTLDPSFDPNSLLVLITLSLQEVAVGLLMAFLLILVFGIITFAGHFIDTPIGFGMASIFDPALGGQVPVFSQVLHVFAALIFFGLDAHIWLLHGIKSSFSIIPFGATLNFNATVPLFMEIVVKMFVIGIQIALPVMATILLSDLGLGIVIRAVPQINVFVLGFPIKIMLGLLIVTFTLPIFVLITSQLFAIDGLLFQFFESLLALGGS